MRANIKEKVHCSFVEGSEDKDIFHYPCLEVYVNLTHLGRVVMLYHTENTVDRNPKVCVLDIKTVNYTTPQHILTRLHVRRHIINGDTMAILVKLSFLVLKYHLKQKVTPYGGVLSVLVDYANDKGF